MPRPIYPKPKQELSVGSNGIETKYYLKTPLSGYDLLGLQFCMWRKSDSAPEIMTNPVIPISSFFEIAFKLLTHEAVKEYAPHLYIGEVTFPGGKVVWGRRIIEIREQILALSGQYGEPLQIEQRDVLRHGEKQHYGGIDFWYDPSDECIHFAQREFSLKAIAEVCGIVLRDLLTAIKDKRRYVPFLVGRPSSDFDGKYIRPNCMVDRRVVPAWRINQHPVSDGPPENMPLAESAKAVAWSDAVEAAKIRELLHGPPETPLDVVAVLDTNPNDDDAPTWGMFKTQGGYSVGAVCRGDDSKWHLDDEFPEVQFSSFRQFLSFVLEVVLSSEFKNNKLPVVVSENTEFDSWLSKDASTSKKPDAVSWVNMVLGDLPDMKFPHALVCGTSYLETQVDGSLVWKNNGESWVFTSESVTDLLLLAISDERANKWPNHYFPLARRAISMDTLTVCTELASSQSSSSESTEASDAAGITSKVAPESFVGSVVPFGGSDGLNIETINILVDVRSRSVAKDIEPSVGVTAQVKEAPVEELVVIEAVVRETPIDPPVVSGSVTTKADQVISDFVRDFEAGASQILANLLS